MSMIKYISVFLEDRRGASTTEYAVITFAMVLILIGLSAFTGLGFLIANRIRDLIIGT